MANLDDSLASFALRNIIRRQIIKCPNERCNQTFALDDLEQHQQVCDFGPNAQANDDRAKKAKGWLCGRSHSSGVFFREHWPVESKLIKLTISGVPKGFCSSKIAFFIQVSHI